MLTANVFFLSRVFCAKQAQCTLAKIVVLGWLSNVAGWNIVTGSQSKHWMSSCMMGMDGSPHINDTIELKLYYFSTKEVEFGIVSDSLSTAP